MRLSAVFVSLFLVFTALAETTHAHEDVCDAPCPAVCLGAPCGMQCETVAAGWTPPEDKERAPLAVFSAGFVPVVFEDEIFHPPVV